MYESFVQNDEVTNIKKFFVARFCRSYSAIAHFQLQTHNWLIQSTLISIANLANKWQLPFKSHIKELIVAFDK